MSQRYHTNAKTNSHSREIIQHSSRTNQALSQCLLVSEKTISKWRNRSIVHDKSSRPQTIKRTLSELERVVIKVIRELTWMPLAALVDCVIETIPEAKKSNVYRTLVNFNINRVPQEERAKAKAFKEYEPGFIHIDVTYLPQFDGQKHYLFVAIDRATRLVYFKVYQNKSSANAVDFLKQCQSFFPFYISHVLTDNGLEFTDRFTQKSKQPSGQHCFDKWCCEQAIDHRLTAPYTPQTNGMVERMNGTIKAATIKAITYQDINALELDLAQFLVFYNFHRRHSGVTKELKVRTPFDALEYWYNIKPDLFLFSPEIFQDHCFNLKEQRGGT